MKSTPSKAPAVVDSAPSASGYGGYALPTWFFMAVALLAYLAHAEIGYNHGLFSAGVYEPYADLRSIPRVGGGVDPVNAGREMYASKGCSACHQPNGSGNPANGCPPLTKSDWVQTEGVGRLIRLVLNGAQGPMTVNGQSWNGVMPPWRDVLSDEEIAYILTYVRQSPEWGNTAGAVSPEAVKAVRDSTANRTIPWTAAELEKIPETE